MLLCVYVIFVAAWHLPNPCSLIGKRRGHYQIPLLVLFDTK